VQTAYRRLLDSRPAGVAPDDPVIEIAWMIEELRVGLFGQNLGTPRPVSERRTVQANHAAQD
jgi:ATP-dependent helicase HrpA